MTEIDTALAEIDAMRSAMTRLETALEQLRGDLLKNSLSQLPRCDVPPSDTAASIAPACPASSQPP